jgi:hypothetical protein
MAAYADISTTPPLPGTTLVADINANSNAILGLAPFRNRLINGGMRIDQRHAGGSVTPTNTQYTIDRWAGTLTQASKFSMQQSTTAPAGFSHSLKMTVLSAYSPGSGDVFGFYQNIEGLNCPDLALGTSSALYITLSFWVRSSVTGTYCVRFTNSAQDRSYVATYAISAANTWEHKTITLLGDTTGTWLATNGVGLNVTFCLGSGSTFNTTAGAWAAGNYLGTSAQTAWINNAAATFYITGVQLESGQTPTNFAYRSFTDELLACQGYFEKSYNLADVPGTETAVGISRLLVFSVGSAAHLAGKSELFHCRKRATPTITTYSNSTGTSGKVRDNTNAADVNSTIENASEGGFVCYATMSGAATNIDLSYHWTADAEI